MYTFPELIFFQRKYSFIILILKKVSPRCGQFFFSTESLSVEVMGEGSLLEASVLAELKEIVGKS